MPHEPNVWQNPQTFTPSTGGTVSASDSSIDQFLIINPATSLASLSLNLPSNASSRIGQLIGITCSQSVASVTLNQIGGGASLLSAPAAFLPGDYYLVTKTLANTWTFK